MKGERERERKYDKSHAGTHHLTRASNSMGRHVTAHHTHLHTWSHNETVIPRHTDPHAHTLTLIYTPLDGRESRLKQDTPRADPLS
jgi:hypothetical protein